MLKGRGRGRGRGRVPWVEEPQLDRRQEGLPEDGRRERRGGRGRRGPDRQAVQEASGELRCNMAEQDQPGPLRVSGSNPSIEFWLKFTQREVASNALVIDPPSNPTLKSYEHESCRRTTINFMRERKSKPINEAAMTAGIFLQAQKPWLAA